MIALLVMGICLAVSPLASSPAQMAESGIALPQRTLAQYNHRAWRLVDGAPPDIWALAQAPDGFLWLGTGSGLYRFDGLLFEKIVPRTGQFPSSNVTSLLITPNGTIWIGFFTGEIARLRDNRLQNYDHSDASVEQFAQEQDGTLWAARTGSRGGLFRFDGAQWRRIAARNGMRDAMAYSVLAARDGAVWVATERHILVRPAGSARFEVVRSNTDVARLAQAPDGQVWVSGDVRPIEHSPIAPDRLAVVPFSSVKSARADRMIFSRDGAFWQTTFGGGVTRMGYLSTTKSPTVERFTPDDGLSSPVAVPVLEDREGNIWVGTNLGLNRLRPVNAVTALAIGLDTVRSFAMAATSDGAVYVASGQWLYRALPGGVLEQFRTLPKMIGFLEAEGEDLIIGQGLSVMRLGNGRMTSEPIARPPGEITSWSRDPHGALWITAEGAGAFRHTFDGWRAADIDGEMVRRSISSPPGLAGGAWLAAHDRLLRRSGSRFHLVAQSIGPRIGRIAVLSQGDAGLLIGGELGLAKLEGNRFRTLGTSQGAAVQGISGIVQTENCEVWINGVRGLLRTTCANLDAAFADPDAPLRHDLFSAADGLPGVAQQSGKGATLVRGGDGRIWMANNVGIGWIDPGRLITNRIPPPVAIRWLESNGRVFTDGERVSLPAGTENLRIAYTALSLAASERLNFRYRLAGIDSDWVEAGTRREAFYANLPPGEWRFQVIAANNDGIWNTQGDRLTISIAPRFYQTTWFRLLCVVAVLAAVWLFYIWRVREHRSHERARVEAQLGERERIARELHDTLLQGVQGLMLRFQAAANATRPGSRAHQLAESALERADDVVIQARDRVRALRALNQSIDLVAWLDATAARYLGDGLSISMSQENEIAAVAPEVAEQLLPILEEALANVLRHARATKVAITVQQSRTQLIIGITDDGIGLPFDVIQSNGKAGHFGLQGMRERAEDLGGSFTIRNLRGGGARVDVCIPIFRQ